MAKGDFADTLATLLDFLRNYTAKHGYAPSVRDIMDGLGASSTSVVNYRLRVLERLGHIERDRGIARGIRLV